MIRSEISDNRCQVKVEGELGRIAFEFAQLTSNLAANMPKVLLKQAFEDGLYINRHGMEAFEKKMKKTIEEFKLEESETEDVKDDDDSDRGKFKDTITMIASALAAAALLGGRNDKTGKH
nr:MAG TPA: hypothetical protein [Caudoviricetes sp.]